jgi:phosphoribosylformylglycinamidine synthase
MTDAPALTAPATEALAREHGLSPAEWAVILDRLGRPPNRVELGIFSVMWSEHCSYKSSRVHLRKLPTTGPRVIQGPGENAGVVDIGPGPNGERLACVFKMESHNHPSFIEPYQGAATGVGGILRDVFTMGARPVALMNALRFGSPDHPKTRRLVAGVVKGIGGYGNCVGVPTVGGETNFHSGYDGNILVNAMAVGIAPADKIFYARGAKPGSPIVYVGAKTGRDGIHGATMASAGFDDASAEKRPTVQVGDPFTEKLLIEACLELMATDAIEAIQDMGAAGLTSSSVEMAGKGGVGVELNLDLVPQRETGMTAYEMMLSESQERMLMILKPGREAEAEAIFRKWELDFAVIGTTTETGRLVLKHKGETVCDIPVAPLSEDAPCYDRPRASLAKPATAATRDVTTPDDCGAALLKLMASPDIASKRWIWEQYDRHVMADTVDSSQSGGDAAIVRIHGTNRALALTCDVTPRYCKADPYEGGKQAVAEAYRNLSAVGATPIAITDCLNFGNPERPEIMAQLVGCIEGMAEAARALDMPIVSGNVSLYNETNGAAVPPTPAVGAVGLIEDLAKKAVIGGMEEEDVLLLVGETRGELGQSLYQREVLGREEGAPPSVDLEAEGGNGAFVRSLIELGLVAAAHDVSDGGLLVAATEMALSSGVGALIDSAPNRVDAPAEGASAASLAAFLFGEDGGRFILAVRPRLVDDVIERARAASVPLFMLGEAGTLTIAVIAAGASDPIVAIPLPELRAAHEGWLPRYMRAE